MNPRPRRRIRRSTSSSSVLPSIIIRRIALLIIVGLVSVVILTSLASVVQSKIHVASPTLKKWTDQLSVTTLLYTLSMEIPQLHMHNQRTGILQDRSTTILLEMVTSINPKDPRSLIRNELPGFSLVDGEIAIAGQGVNYTDFPVESAPPIEVVMKEKEANVEGLTVPESREGENEAPTRTTEGRKAVFIYHTHNRESWLPHLPSATHANEAFHPEVNITLVGQRLGEELEKRGIGTAVDRTDITQKLNQAGMKYADSYTKSKEVVQTVLAQEEDITFIFDLHRDSLGRERTTVTIDGITYARTYFVIGTRNQNHEKNLAFAEQFHDKLEEAYPGLSRGVFLQPRGHGEYNQTLSENNILIEIGGVENTLEESYRTAEALAEVIADMYWKAEKVNANQVESKY